MRIFDYRHLAEAIPAELLGISNILYDLRGRNDIRKKDKQAVYDDLRESAIIDSVAGSNAIEGIVTSRSRMMDIVLGGQDPLTHDEHEIAGYKAALEEIYSPDFSADLSEDLIRHFHRLLLQGTSAEAGSYKTEDNWISQRDADGTISVRFVPVSAKETPRAMEQWLLAYREARSDARISRLFLVACAVVDFLCIHPFTDGNGRLSRLITTLLLQREGFDVGRYISIEDVINDTKAAYYDALYEASQGWHDNKNDYTPFIIYLMQVLYRCYRELDTRFVESGSKRLPKSKQIEALLMGTFVPISKEEICRRYPDVSVTTISRVLSKLIKAGSVEKIGTYRDARYRRKP